MKNIIMLVALFVVYVSQAYAASHHSGHRGSRAASTWDTNCVHSRIDKLKPAHLATVAPGSEFSFVISNIDDPSKQISILVKQQIVDFTTEFKDPNYLVKGKIPAALRNTAARIDVKINAKATACRSAEGWLVKISE